MKQDLKECYIKAKSNQKLCQIFYAQMGNLTQWSTNHGKIQLCTYEESGW